jgi:hypothetical protein
MINTTEVREIKFVVMPDGETQAFYRFVNSRSLFWHSIKHSVALRAVRDGKMTWAGTKGPVIEHKKGE